jgi:hypothetical protein
MGALKMKNAKKYRGLKFLDGVQARIYLEGLTETEITWSDLLGFIRTQERDLYADIKAISHKLTDWHFIDGPHDPNDAGRMYADNVDGEAVRVKDYAKHLPHRDYPIVYFRRETIHTGNIDHWDLEDTELFFYQYYERAGSELKEYEDSGPYLERPKITFLTDGLSGDLFQATDDNTGQIIQCNVLRPTKEGREQYVDMGEYEAYFLRQDIESMAAIINNTPGESPAVPAENDRKEYPPQLEVLTLAWRKNWKNADPTDRNTCPKKESVKNWLMRQGFSAKNADAGATIIKPQWATDKGW